MEPIRRKPQDITPGRPMPARPNIPTGHRPVFSDFTARPQARPTAGLAPRSLPSQAPGAPALPSKPAHQVVASYPQPVQPLAPTLKPTAAQAIPSAPQISHTPAPVVQSTPSQTFASPTQAAAQPAENPAPSSTEPQPARRFAASAKVQEHKSHPSRAGLVGFICFVVLGGLLLSPVLPGKIFDSFPGSSQSLSTGDDSPACIHELEAVSSALSYNRKLGSPITYSYATTTTQKATCDGKQQTAIAGRAGQFNPLGLLIDSALALIVSVIVSKVWRRVFHEQN